MTERDNPSQSLTRRDNEEREEIMAQLKLKLSQEQSELTAVCAEHIQAELNVYTVLLSSAEGPSIPPVQAACNVLFQIGIALAKNNSLDPDDLYMVAKTLVRADKQTSTKITDSDRRN
jgi:hypothetical protein